VQGACTRRVCLHSTPYCNIIEAPWLVNGGHGASLRHHISWLPRSRRQWTGMHAACGWLSSCHPSRHVVPLGVCMMAQPGDSNALAPAPTAPVAAGEGRSGRETGQPRTAAATSNTVRRRPTLAVWSVRPPYLRPRGRRWTYPRSAQWLPS
jgi:hypothetical protein